MNYKTDLASRLESLRNIEGFPIGKDEDILALSDPPHFTACPNPYIAEFIEKYGKPYDEATDDYHREPFVADVSEGKNDPIYNAHSYHTKVPHKAIMPFIEHYTEPGDIVLDAFCGTGMTGVAAQLLGRRAILSDLSPIAAFIAYNYNSPVDVKAFEKEARRILAEVEEECGWMYETAVPEEYVDKMADGQLDMFERNKEGKPVGKINYTVWSDVFLCSYCHGEYVFWNAAVDKMEGKVLHKYPCPHCKAELSKKDSERVSVVTFDKATGEEITRAIQVPVLINYSVKTKEKNKWKENRLEKEPDGKDIALIKEIEKVEFPYWFPADLLPTGYNTEQPKKSHGSSHAHLFFTKRNLYVISSIWGKINSGYSQPSALRQALLGGFGVATIMSRFRVPLWINKTSGPMKGMTGGILYIPSIMGEQSILNVFKERISVVKRMEKIQANLKKSFTLSITTANQSLTPESVVDYIFTDPPFGSNLMYSELNFLWEAWLKVFTNNHSEAIINKTQQKGLDEYAGLMRAAFREYYRVLKPKRWITVVFHNSKSAVWNAIQEGMTRAGFIIASVTTLDKKQGSFKQVTAPGAVANDLIINAYKPARNFEESFLSQAGEGMEAAFIEQFLSMQPVQPILERTEKMLYSKMLAYYIQHGYEVRYDARSFYRMLSEHFAQEDGYWFTAGQINSYVEYRKRMQLEGMGEVRQGSMHLFVSDERSALAWLFQYLAEPKSYSDILTAFNQIATIQDDQVPELRELLEENFIAFDGRYRRPRTEPEHDEVITKREKALLREFESLLLQAQSSKCKIKSVRKEAVLLGFEQRYKQKRFKDILDLAKRLDRGILDASPELSEFVEAAEIAVGGV